MSKNVKRKIAMKNNLRPGNSANRLGLGIFRETANWDDRKIGLT